MRTDSYVSGIAGNETILVYIYISDNSVPVSNVDILMKGIPIAKASHGEKWKVQLDSYDSVKSLYLVGYFIEYECTSQVYRFDLLSNNKIHFCPSSIDSAILHGKLSLSILKIPISYLEKVHVNYPCKSSPLYYAMEVASTELCSTSTLYTPDHLQE